MKTYAMWCAEHINAKFLQEAREFEAHWMQTVFVTSYRKMGSADKWRK